MTILYEIISARRYYGRHATGAVVLRNGYPIFHGATQDARLFFARVVTP